LTPKRSLSFFGRRDAWITSGWSRVQPHRVFPAINRPPDIAGKEVGMQIVIVVA
jgi:hypothetical protein